MSSKARTRRRWTEDEDETLRREAERQLSNGALKNWNSIAAKLPERTNKDCRKRWSKVCENVKKGAWSSSEDERLQTAVEQYGQRWTNVAEKVGTRYPDQCAMRWQNSLDPSIDRSQWTIEMDDHLIAAVAKSGRNWKAIGETEFVGRSQVDLKNRYALLDRRQRQTLGLSESEYTTSVASLIAEADTANMDSNTYSESIGDHFDAALLDLNDMHPYMDTHRVHDSFSVESSLYSQGSSAFLEGRNGQDRELTALEDRINFSPDIPDSSLRQPRPTMDPWGGVSFIADSIQSWTQCTPQSNEQTRSVDSSQCIESSKNLQSPRNKQPDSGFNQTRDDAPSGSGAESRNIPPAGPVHSVVLEDVQPETLNTIMDTLLKSGTKFKINLFNP